jgi:hypothetical protein
MLESAREPGREEVLERGSLVEKIQLLQQLLSKAPSSTTDLEQRSLDDLALLLNDRF